MVYADGTARLRALFLGSMTSAWYEASDDERRERILPRFAQLMNEWREIGANVLATVDDDLLMVGHPESTGTTFYVILEIDAPRRCRKDDSADPGDRRRRAARRLHALGGSHRPTVLPLEPS